MTKTITSPVTVEEKNHWLGKLAFAALIALKLAQWDGKAARNAQSENLFCCVGYKRHSNKNGFIAALPTILNGSSTLANND